jgi:hypothetical protein
LSQVFKARPNQPLPPLSRVSTKSKTPPAWAFVLFFAVLAAAQGVFTYVDRYTGPTAFMQVKSGMTLAEIEATVGRPADIAEAHVSESGFPWTGYQWRSEDGHFVLIADFPGSFVVLVQDRGTSARRSWKDGHREN